MTEPTHILSASNTTHLRTLGLALLLQAPLLHAWAHDTWFEPQPARAAGEIRLALGTGNQFPQQEISVGGGSLVAQGCREGNARQTQMRILRDTERALLLRARAPSKKAAGSVTCWAQQQPFEVEITPDKIPVYLKEIAASPALRGWPFQSPGAAPQEPGALPEPWAARTPSSPLMPFSRALARLG